MGTRGTLRVYLGAAPGVGKTYAMLAEGRRRKSRGADVVVAFVETHGRANTAAQLADLEVVARHTVRYRGAELPEMDLDAVLARRPEVALVDELAHTNAPGCRHQKRWQDVECLLDAGIHVITTVNVQHLESLNDVVSEITGSTQHETVPDRVVRRADQIELVDMSPEALRRRMAHGNIYPAERIDAALSNYFRPGNLGALRELALLWVADRVEDALDSYRRDHHITKPWETRERVVVAVTAAAGNEAVIRRAARIAGRRGGELLGVHIHQEDGRRHEGAGLAQRRDLVTQLGGRYYEVAAADIAAALVQFARAEGATQIVLGATARSRWQETTGGSVVNRVLRSAAGIDVHVIAGRSEGGLRLARPRGGYALPRWRQLSGWLIVTLGLPSLTVVAASQRHTLSLSTALLVYLALVVAAGAVGGMAPALTGALVASLLANYYLVEPLHTFTIRETENIVALAVFVIVAATVSSSAHLAARRADAAQRARSEAEALSRASATLASSPDPVPDLLEHVRVTLGLGGAALLQPDQSGWTTIAAAGASPSAPSEGAIELQDGASTVLAFTGTVDAADRIVLASLADQLAVGLAARRSAEDVARAHALSEADALRRALLQAVSHDLRTPLAGIKASVSSLLAADVSWDEPTRQEFLQTIDSEADRLNHLVSNLLDLSRLQAGTVAVKLGHVAVDDVVAAALASLSHPPGHIDINVEPTLPLVYVDPALVERAVANLVANAAAWSPEGRSVRLDAALLGQHVVLRVIDRGPGIPPNRRDDALQPFQRLGDSGGGLGLGLAVASGFIRAVGGDLTLEDTPGGGLTVEVRLPTNPVSTPEATV